MKKFFLVSLVVISTSIAVEWDVEQITNTEGLVSLDPVLDLDEAGRPYVLFWQGNEVVHLWVADKDSGGWFMKDVGIVSWDMLPYYSIAVGADGKVYVSYSDISGGPDKNELFLACDSSGAFEVKQLTDDALIQRAPVVRIHEGAPHLICAQEVVPAGDIQLFHGWLDAESGEFANEQITEDLYQEDLLGCDLVFDQSGVPHVFYIGDDDHLWHTTSGEPSWIAEQLNELSSEWPSAVADPSGFLHVAYDVGGDKIHYITNVTGTWQDELVFPSDTEDSFNYRPSIDLDQYSNPHVVWNRLDGFVNPALWYSSKKNGDWVDEGVIPGGFDISPEPGYGRYFAIDALGYGHLVYSMYDYSTGSYQIYYAKSKEPLATGIVEDRQLSSSSLRVEVKGSRILFYIPQTSIVRLSLYDVSGCRVQEIAQGFYASGQHEKTINPREFSSGVYFVRAETSGKSASARLVLIK